MQLKGNKMDYNEFSKKAKEYFDGLMKYSNNQYGSIYYAEKLGELEDNYPEFMDKFFEEA